MTSEAWRLVRLSECAGFQEGYVNPSQTEPSYFGDDVKWLRATDLNNGFVFETGRRLSRKGFESAGKSAKLFEPGSLAISKSGTIGRIGILQDYMCGNRAVINIKPNQICDSRFIFYTLLHRRREIETLAEGSVQKNLYVSTLGKLEIALPPLELQKSIASLLGALDDRITLLRETNATVETIAQALFKSWFVDFDPVHAKMESRVPDGMDEATAALFPDGFAVSELGAVPKGWSRIPFTDTVKVIGGGTPKTSIPEYWDGDIPWFSVVDAPAATNVFVIDTAKKISVQGVNNSSTKLLAEGTTIISARGTVGRLALVGREMAMNQSCYGLRGKADDAYFTYFSTYRLVEQLKQRSHGSVFDTITTETMRGVFVVYPDKNTIQAFETVLTPLMNRIKANLKQEQTLTALRDTLLPRLISGQLRISEAVAQIDALAA